MLHGRQFARRTYDENDIFIMEEKAQNTLGNLYLNIGLVIVVVITVLLY